MEVKPGYKQTDVGVIPEDWEARPLGTIAPIATGNTPSTREPTNYGDKFLFVSPVDMGLTKHISRTEKMLSRKGFSISRPFPAGSVLFVCIGSTIGKCGIASETLTSNQQINAILPSAGMLCDYLYYAVSAVALKVKALAGEQAVPIVNKTAFSDTQIPVPPTKAEQEAIAGALSDADALIESLELLITKKRELKQGAMQELLTGKKRLPGFSGDWVVKPLGEIAHIKTGGRNNQDKVEDGEYPFFVRSATVERINSYSYNCEAILVPGEGGIGSIFHYIRGRFDVHQRVYAITQFTPETSGRFVYFYMAEKFGIHAMQNSVKATVDSLRLPTFQNFEIVMPPTSGEQTAIASILSDMDAELAALETKLAKARQLKQGMMQELLTGNIRLV